MEKDNDSNEESSDYSCSPVTKNELLTAAKYRAIKFAILLVLAISNLSVPFHLFKVLKQTPSCSPPSENQETKEKILPLPPSILENLNSFKILSFPFLVHFLHPYVSFIISLSLAVVLCSAFLSYIS